MVRIFVASKLVLCNSPYLIGLQCLRLKLKVIIIGSITRTLMKILQKRWRPCKMEWYSKTQKRNGIPFQTLFNKKQKY